MQELPFLFAGGSPHCGKSTIAQRIANKTCISHFPLDSLVHALEKTHPTLGIQHLRGEGPKLPHTESQSIKDIRSAATTGHPESKSAKYSQERTCSLS